MPFSKEMNSILFSNTQKFYMPDWHIHGDTYFVSDNSKSNSFNYEYAFSINRNLETMGYTLDEASLENLARLDSSDIIKVWNDLVYVINEKTGASDFNKAELFYPNFPEEVMNEGDIELYFNSLYYYYNMYKNHISVRDDIVEIKKDRLPLIESVPRELKVINLGTKKDLFTLMHDRVHSLSMSDAKLEELKAFIKEYPKDWQILILNSDEKFQSKENLTNIANVLIKENKINDAKTLFKDATDVLRLAAVLSAEKGYTQMNANLSFSAKDANFKFTNAEKIMLKDFLNNCPNLYIDIWKQEAKWKKAMRFLDTKKGPVRVVKAFDNLYQKKKVLANGKPVINDVSNLNMLVDKYCAADIGSKESAESFDALYAQVSKNPGLMLNCLVESLKKANKPFQVAGLMTVFSKACKEKPIPVINLLKVKNLIERRDDWENRIFKNKKQKLYAVENKPMKLSSKSKEIITSFLDKIIDYEVENTMDLKNVYIDPALCNNIVPLRGERNASSGATLTKGSVIEGNKDRNLLAVGIYWKDSTDEYNCDIDVSVTAFDEDFNKKGNVYYGNVKTSWGVHSGDYVIGGNGVAELIIADKSLLKEAGIKYLVSEVHGYSVPFSKAENVRFVRMEKEGTMDWGDCNSKECKGTPTFCGEPFEISQIEDPIRLDSNSTLEVPFIYDVDEDKYYWVDTNINIYGIRNVQNIESISTAMCEIYNIKHNNYPDMKQLFDAYARNNGTIVDNIEDADTIFLSKPQDAQKLHLKEDATIISAYDLDTISKEFCGVRGKLPEQLEIAQEKEVPKHKSVSKEDNFCR